MGDFSSRYRIVAAVGKAPYIQVVARAKKPQFDPIASAINQVQCLSAIICITRRGCACAIRACISRYRT